MMRRTVVVGATVLVVVALATPAGRRGMDALADKVRARIAAFRADYAAREAELRERLLPEDAVVDAARHRADPR